MQLLYATETDTVSWLRQIPFFADLPEQTLLSLAPGASLRRYSAGEVICWHGDECAGMYSLVRGRVKLFKLSPKGRELVIRVLGAGTIFNEVPVFDKGPNVVSIAALEDSDICLVEKDVILGAIRTSPELAEQVMLTLSGNLRVLVSQLEELSFYQVTNRLARLISQLSEEQLAGTKGNRLTQDLMAARLGTVREVVARSLRELEESGAIHVRRGKIEIVDRPLLEEWAQEPCP
jgi:CRP/FNR family transcriptional regulator